MTIANSSNTNPMIQLSAVSKRYLMGEVTITALENVSLAIERGEFVSIMGPSGSGKSSLLQILGALDTPTEGVYALEGHDISRLPDHELARIRNQNFGFIFQAYNLFGELNAVDNVALPLTYAGVKLRERRERALAQLEAVGLSNRMKHMPSQLSGGQQQRVAIARALVTDPTLVLADEPTGNLSQRDGDEILQILERLNTDGVSIVLVTHDPRVGALAKRTIGLEDGKVINDSQVSLRTQLVPETVS
jgi:putative ABC transport system ATP-binding protein